MSELKEGAVNRFNFAVLYSISLFCTQFHHFALNFTFLHWFGINWRALNQSECRNCCLYIIIAVTKTQLFRQILSKPGCESNILVILFLPFSHDIYQPLCNIYILHARQRFPANNLYTCIYYNKHRAISTKQTSISKTDGDTDRIQRT